MQYFFLKHNKNIISLIKVYVAENWIADLVIVIDDVWYLLVVLLTLILYEHLSDLAHIFLLFAIHLWFLFKIQFNTRIFWVV